MRNFNEMVIKRYIPNDVETKDLKKNLHSPTRRSFIHAQVCACPNTAYFIKMLGKYLNNS